MWPEFRSGPAVQVLSLTFDIPVNVIALITCRAVSVSEQHYTKFFYKLQLIGKWVQAASYIFRSLRRWCGRTKSGQGTCKKYVKSTV